jgi:3-oxoacyl-[acyl-carrier-protein] synthase II
VLFPSANPKPPCRVVVTGAGIITALGSGWATNAEGFRQGRVAIRPVTVFNTARQRVKVAGEVDLPEQLPRTRLTKSQERRLERAARLLLFAAHEAWEQTRGLPTTNLPLVLGTSSGGMSLGEDYYRQAIQTPVSRRRQAARAVHYQAQRPGLDLADAFGFHGPVTIIANACASGANAIGHAWDLLRTHQAPCALAGGYDGLSQMVFAGFDSLQALSPTRCRPFDAQRDGLAIGEGAAVLALESLEHAEGRGAEVLGEIVGYGAATDAHHLTQPQPQGKAAFSSMTAACNSAHLTPAQIAYVNAHGTGTVLNDSAEASAINRWAGEHVNRLRVSSTKSSIGHLLGAAGAVEAVVCLMTLREQWFPPTSTTQTADSLCEFQLVREPAAGCLNCALSNSFGFGGANASLIFRRWP